MDIKSYLRESIRAHVRNQSKQFRHLPLEDRRDHVSFYLLNHDEKRKLIAALLVSNEFDSSDLMFQLNDQKSTVNKILFKCIVNQSITKEKAIDEIIDSILLESGDLIEEMFEEEWNEYYSTQMEMWGFSSIVDQINMAMGI